MAGEEWSVEIGREGPLVEEDARPEEAVFAAAREALEDLAELLRREAAERAPRGATGHLRGSIAASVRGRALDSLEGEVGTPAAYAPAVEFGRRPGGPMPPWRAGSALFRWVRGTLGAGGREAERVSFRVARAIGRRGIPGRHIFRDALAGSLGRIEERLRRLGLEIARALGG